MYIADFPGGLSGALCGDCIDRCTAGQGPPWKPDAIDRQTGMLKLALRPVFVPRPAPEEVFKLMAEFLQPWGKP
jgi:hypothetical protein